MIMTFNELIVSFTYLRIIYIFYIIIASYKVYYLMYVIIDNNPNKMYVFAM